MKSKKIIVSLFVFLMLCAFIPTAVLLYSADGNLAVDEAGQRAPVRAVFTGTVSQGSDSTQHEFSVPTGASLIEVQLSFSSSYDFDLSMWDNLDRRTGGWTASDHSE